LAQIVFASLPVWKIGMHETLEDLAVIHGEVCRGQMT